MKLNKLITLFSLTLVFGLGLVLVPKSVSHAQLQEKWVKIYEAQPRTYDHTVEPPYFSCSDFRLSCNGESSVREQDKGQTFTNNRNPWGFEIYRCDSKGGTVTTYNTLNHVTIPVDFFAKRDSDICIPQATEVSEIKRWPQNTTPNFRNLLCDKIQHLVDGPNQSFDNHQAKCVIQEDESRICEGSLNSEIRICSERSAADPGPNPFIDVTTNFVYKPFMCQGLNQVVLAGRQDPNNSECQQLNLPDVMNRPWDYTASQLSCLLYFDDIADVVVEKNSQSEFMRIKYTHQNGIHPTVGSSVSLCPLFKQGEGTYKVNVKVWDVGTQVYGAGDLWLTWKQNICGATSPINLRVARLQSNEATLQWTSGTGGNKQWLMLDTDQSKVENDCVGGCLINDRNLWDDQSVYVFGQSHGIRPDTTYFWKVMEIDTNTPNCRADSNVATFTTPKDCFAPESRLYVKGPNEVVFDLKPNGTSQTFNGDHLDYYVTSTGKGQNIDFFREFTYWDLRHTLKNQWQYHTKIVTIPANFEHYGGKFYVILKTSKRNSTIYFDDVVVEVKDPSTGSFVPITTNSGFEQGSNGSIPTDWSNNSYLADHNNFKTGPMDGVDPKSGLTMLHVELGNEYGHHGSEVVQTFSEDLRGQTVRVSGWTYSKDNLTGDYLWAGIALGYWVVEGGDIEKIHYGVDENMNIYEVPVPQPPEPRRSAKIPDQAFIGSGVHIIGYYAEDSCNAIEGLKTFEFKLVEPTPTPSLIPIPTLTPTPEAPAAYFQTQNGDVHSGGKINNSNLPAGESLGDFVVSTGNPLVFSDFGAGQASQKGWRLGSYSIANSSDSIWPIFKNGFYQYFTRQFPVGSKPGIKQITSAAQIEKDKTQTYYVDGGLTITQDLEFSSPVSVVVVVKGDLIIDVAVARVDGLFLVDGEVRTGGGNLALVNQGGMAVSNLSRSRLVFQRKPVKPADDLFAPPGELFVGSPKYFVLLNELLGERKITFLETY